MPSKFSQYLTAYKGAGLVLLTAVAAIWLAATGQLELYIHPRYIVFTSVFSVIAALMVIYGTKYGSADTPHGEGALNQINQTDCRAEPLKRTNSYRRLPRQRTIVAALAALVCLFGAAALLITRPLPLTSATATQRGINAAATPSTSNRQPVESPLFANNDYSSFTINDWVGLLAQTDDPAFFAGKNASVVGFVVADANDKNVFYVSRFVVTCCAVDARPIGLAVYAPDWQLKFGQDDWVEVSGKFVPNPSALNFEIVALEPSKLQKTTQPERVYDY